MVGSGSCANLSRTGQRQASPESGPEGPKKGGQATEESLKETSQGTTQGSQATEASSHLNVGLKRTRFPLLQVPHTYESVTKLSRSSGTSISSRTLPSAESAVLLAFARCAGLIPQFSSLPIQRLSSHTDSYVLGYSDSSLRGWCVLHPRGYAHEELATGCTELVGAARLRASCVPRGLHHRTVFPTAYGVGCILAPLRGLNLLSRPPKTL